MMKKTIGLLVFLLIFGLGFSFQKVEASSVTYQNQADRFLFLPGDKDLFENFKGVMPGDVRTQSIVMRNDSPNIVDFFLKINPVDEEARAFLSQMNLTVEEGGEIIFNEALDEQGLFEDYRLIRSLDPESETVLELQLEVSKAMGNAFMDQEAEVEWIIMIEEIEIEDVDPIPLPEEEEEEEPEEEEEDPEIEIVDDKPLPSTGERQEYFLLYGGGLLLLGGLFFTYDLRRKTKKKS